MKKINKIWFVVGCLGLIVLSLALSWWFANAANSSQSQKVAARKDIRNLKTACQLFDQASAVQFLGQQVEPGKSSQSNIITSGQAVTDCFYKHSEGRQISLKLVNTDQQNAEKYYLEAAGKDPRAFLGLDFRAYWNAQTKEVNSLKGDNWLRVNYFNPTDPDNFQGALQISQIIMSKL